MYVLERATKRNGFSRMRPEDARARARAGGDPYYFIVPAGHLQNPMNKLQRGDDFFVVLVV